VQEKTVKPSQRKLKKAKEKGDVAKSSELVAACVFLVALGLIGAASQMFKQRFHALFSEAYQWHVALDPIISLKSAVSLFAYLVLAILAGVFIISLLAQVLQTGWIWSWGKAASQEGFRWLFFPTKLLVISFAGYLYVSRQISAQNQLFPYTAENIFLIFKKIFFLLLILGSVWFFLGIGDLIYQKQKHYKRMHMTRQEAKEEKRETEGPRSNKSR
jgi:flagellar biosynthetic protein FlhB